MTDVDPKTIVCGAKREDTAADFVRDLESNGYRIVFAFTGPDLVRLAASRLPCAVLVDIDIPKLNGFQCSRVLKSDAITKSIPVFHITESAAPIERYWSRFCGGEALLVKTETVHSFLETLKEYPIFPPPRKNRFLKGNILADLDDLSLTGLANSLLEGDLLHANILNEINLIDTTTLTFAELSAATLAIVGTLFEFTLGAVLKIDEPEGELLVWSNRQIDDTEYSKLKRLTLDHLDKCHSIHLDPERTEITVLQRDRRTFDPNLSNEISFHVADAPTPGAIVLFENLYPDHFDKREKETFQTAMTLVYSILDKKRQFQKAQRFSIIDNETNGFSHEFFMTILSREVENASRNNYPLTLFTLTITALEQKFDENEDNEARKLHIILYKLILSVMRKSDIVARIEKTSYVFLLTHTSSEKAQIALDRIRTHVQRSLDKLISPAVSLKISSGIHQLNPETDTSPEALMRKALPRQSL